MSQVIDFFAGLGSIRVYPKKIRLLRAQNICLKKLLYLVLWLHDLTVALRQNVFAICLHIFFKRILRLQRRKVKIPPAAG